jgi:integrase
LRARGTVNVFGDQVWPKPVGDYFWLLFENFTTLSRGHHAALPWADVPAFVAKLRHRDGVAAICLKFVILTACRTGEAIGARWDEIAGDVWTVPAVRMKTKRPHRVPLSPRCLAILDELRQFGSPWVFPGGTPGRPLSNMAMLELVKSQRITVHGFRSSFRDWAAEATSFPGEVVEMCLAHTIASRVEAAYRRGDMLDRRREVMMAWERYCCGVGNVVRLATR